MTVDFHHGDCLEVLPTLAANSVDAVITDPPYHLTQLSRNGSPRQNDPNTPFGRTRLGSKGIAGKTWDGGDVAMRPETWRLVYDVLKPGARLLGFSGTRTYHRMVCAIEDAGFEIMDQIGWITASGMPKSHHSLKPAWEPIVMARKPLAGSVQANIEAYGCGGLNIDACRLPIDPAVDDPRLGGKGEWSTASMGTNVYGKFAGTMTGSSTLGRWPSNLITDGSEEVLDAFARFGEKTSGKPGVRRKPHETNSMSGRLAMTGKTEVGFGDTGSAARFFQSCLFNEDEEFQRFHYSGKAKTSDRAGSKHPTVKPISLMRFLCKLVVPPGGTVLDLFAGSGTTGEAAVLEGFNAILIEKEDEYAIDIRNRLALFLTVPKV